MRRLVSALFPAVFLAVLSGCGGSSSSPTPTPKQSIQYAVSPSSIDLQQDGTKSTVSVTATCQNLDTVSADITGLPTGVTASVTQPTCSTAGSIDFTVTDVANARATSYTVVVGTPNAANVTTAKLAMNVVAQAAVTRTATGLKTAFMSTSFQLADWSYSWLNDHPATIPPLNNLAEQHIRIQLIDGAVPQIDAANWDFTKADATIQPLLAVGDDSPELQIGTVPAFLGDSSGHYVEANLPAFAEYCANLVRYYNKGGFSVGGKLYKSLSSTPIKWWGIFNEPNWNSVTPAQYPTMYNAVAASMLAVDPDIKLVGLELGDVTGMAQSYMPPLLSGVTQPMHALASHYYSTCNQKDSDVQLFSQVQMFHDQTAYIRTTLDANAPTAGLPIWITENNVNADYDKGGGISACNGGAFTEDDRGTSAYFAAWRPFVYSQMVHAGAAGIWHWSFYGGGQYGEYADDSTPYLSYWVDYELSHLLGQESMTEVSSSVTEPSRIEMFAAKAADGSRVIMVVNHDVAADSDNNGQGVPKKVQLDLSGAGSFTTATLIAVDKSTSIATGPTTTTLTPTAGVVTLTFPGYGVQFVQLK
ncbi:hypothetical protein Acid345_3646 [Candidatus Koribacter versatilis Ellin345]|uniref:Uncharacterized protein n=1 Tax=Koribacter versatilis (strain Ellin345) TaxID=204669 RepID=Q1IKF3_KORVE|nr:hypothetical protein [Candidatus Koribacter versatilis]ABF42647.1 hypothetical protein Acid345_3646 [Candidatus Koribacter versatilis Ellin345]